MKIRKITAALLSLALTLTALAGCGDSGSSSEKSTDTTSFAQNAGDTDGGESAPAILEEPDFMGFLTGESDTNYYNMKSDEFDQLTGGVFNEQNAIEYSDWEGITGKYSLGKKDSILGGRVKLDKEYEVICILSFKKNKLKEMSLRIDGLTVDEADKICADFLKAFEGKLPDKYEAYPPLEHGNIYEVGYVSGVDDYIVSMRRNRAMSDDYYVLFTLENYAERYGMN